MSDFKAKMHQIRFPLPLGANSAPRLLSSTWLFEYCLLLSGEKGKKGRKGWDGTRKGERKRGEGSVLPRSLADG